MIIHDEEDFLRAVNGGWGFEGVLRERQPFCFRFFYEGKYLGSAHWSWDYLCWLGFECNVYNGLNRLGPCVRMPGEYDTWEAIYATLWCLKVLQPLELAEDCLDTE